MTSESQPARSRDMAQLCRSTCGVGCLLRSDGQRAAAVAAGRATRHPEALPPSGMPLPGADNRVSGQAVAAWTYTHDSTAVGPGDVGGVLLMVGQEVCDERGVQVDEVELAGLVAGAAGGEAEQQPQGVAVGGDGVGAGVALADEPLGEVGLQGRGERAHACLPAACSRRWAASDSSSGTADRYQ